VRYHRGYWGLIPRDAMLPVLGKMGVRPGRDLAASGLPGYPSAACLFVLAAPTSPSPTSLQISTRRWD